VVYRTMTQEDFGVFCVVSNLCYFCFLSSFIFHNMFHELNYEICDFIDTREARILSAVSSLKSILSLLRDYHFSVCTNVTSWTESISTSSHTIISNTYIILV